MTDAADVVIVGGGIMGAATAFFLRRHGRSVIVLERNLVGQHASGTNFGNVRRQGRFLQQLPLANRARAVWGRMTELLGEDAEFLASGHLRVCYDKDQVGVLETYARDAAAYGLDLELLSSNMLRNRFPFLGVDVIAGSLAAEDGHANPRLAAPAFARAAARAGAIIREGVEVTAVERVGRDFRIAPAAGAEVRAPVVLITAGAWGPRLCERFDGALPYSVQGPQMGVTEPVPYAIAPALGVASDKPEEGVYFRQVKRGNVVFGGGPRGPASIDSQRAAIRPANSLGQLRQLRRLTPALAHLQVIRTWSGVEGYMDDDRPVMGPSATTPGLFYAFGFCGHGFQLGPGVGETMAELIATGATSISLAPFAVDRFAAAPDVAGPDRRSA